MLRGWIALARQDAVLFAPAATWCFLIGGALSVDGPPWIAYRGPWNVVLYGAITCFTFAGWQAATEWESVVVCFRYGNRKHRWRRHIERLAVMAAAAVVATCAFGVIPLLAGWHREETFEVDRMFLLAGLAGVGSMTWQLIGYAVRIAVPRRGSVLLIIFLVFWPLLPERLLTTMRDSGAQGLLYLLPDVDRYLPRGLAMSLPLDQVMLEGYAVVAAAWLLLSGCITFRLVQQVNLPNV